MLPVNNIFIVLWQALYTPATANKRHIYSTVVRQMIFCRNGISKVFGKRRKAHEILQFVGNLVVLIIVHLFK